MFESLVKFLAKVWERLKKIWVAIVSFIRNIANWFKRKYQEVIQKRPNAKALSYKIKGKLESGDYSELDIGLDDTEETLSEKDYVIVNTFYDVDTDEILEEYTEVIESDKLDDDTISAFGDKDMLVLK